MLKRFYLSSVCCHDADTTFVIRKEYSKMIRKNLGFSLTGLLVDWWLLVEARAHKPDRAWYPRDSCVRGTCYQVLRVRQRVSYFDNRLMAAIVGVEVSSWKILTFIQL